MKRTPRNYDGIAPPGKLIGEILLGITNSLKNNRGELLLEAWPEIIGSKMAKWTQAKAFVDGVLTVIVKSSTLYSVLNSEKPELLIRVQGRFPKVRNILFRVG
jgi:hypothetical protein